ncbi:MAG: ribosome assembly RNA-binding protein YhbY [Lachnospira sp.]|nr:ribosome assembly RNA-binding protein YhbY [Lachnospira sp.]
MTLTSKQRAYLMGLASNLNPIFNVGKASLTPEIIEGIGQALEKRELIKVSVLKNCADDPKSIAEMIGERTHSIVVKVIGKKMIFYKPCKDKNKRKIELPK